MLNDIQPFVLQTLFKTCFFLITNLLYETCFLPCVFVFYNTLEYCHTYLYFVFFFVVNLGLCKIVYFHTLFDIRYLYSRLRTSIKIKLNLNKAKMILSQKDLHKPMESLSKCGLKYTQVFRCTAEETCSKHVNSFLSFVFQWLDFWPMIYSLCTEIPRPEGPPKIRLINTGGLWLPLQLPWNICEIRSICSFQFKMHKNSISTHCNRKILWNYMVFLETCKEAGLQNSKQKSMVCSPHIANLAVRIAVA